MADTPSSAFSEPPIVIHNREQLLYTLTEAAEIEHNLMCCYLYAAWSLKTEADDGVDPALQSELKKWQRAILDIAIDEMTHLALVANLTNALGGVAHFGRPNFPIATGMLPAGLKVRLAPFTRETLQHFIFLERPEGSDEPDGEGFAGGKAYERGQHGLRLTPAAQDYQTVGHLYRSVEAGMKSLVAQLGEEALFLGDPALQVGPDIVSLDGLIAITDLKSACQALETIVEQGEGASAHSEQGHYHRFVQVREAYDRFLRDDPAFAPAFPAANNPVMRHPPEPEGKVWVSRDEPRGVIDLGNAIYNHMLRCLAQGFAATDPDEKRLMINAAIDLMMAVDPLAKELARLKANDDDECNAGLSFATLRNAGVPRSHPNVLRGLANRSAELCEGASALSQTPRVARATKALLTITGTLQQAAGLATVPDVEAKPDPVPAPVPVAASEPPASSGPEIVEGSDLTLVVDMKRCIHSRFCVTGAPKTFIANIEGPWLHPDETDADLLIEIAHACPSGAIGYRGKTKPDESAPNVNMMRIRENGPNAIHAPMTVAGEDIGFRATFCRCGQSKNKPYCDGSHHDVGFVASGEPETISLDPLSVRDGPLQIDPQRNGPLRVTGNLEICAGTGRVVKRVESAVLCRCGHSKNKPFCDGSHRAAGFEADGA